MTCVPYESEIGRADLFSRPGEDLAELRRRVVTTVKRTRAITIVSALGIAFHVMKWAGVFVL